MFIFPKHLPPSLVEVRGSSETRPSIRRHEVWKAWSLSKST